MRILDCDYPDALLYDVESGTWAKESGDTFVVGVAPSLGWISGGFTSVKLKTIGTRVARGRSLGSVEGLHHFDVIRAPFDCTITEVNPLLTDNPRLANKDPFGDGWLVKVQRLGDATSLVALPGAAANIASKLEELRVHCFVEFPDREIYEIGVECSAVLAQLSEVLSGSPAGTTVHVVSDDSMAAIEMERWQDQTGNSVLESRREGALFHFIVKKRQLPTRAT